MQIQKEKKGGPYTKQEQEKRRKQVYELHFEKAYSSINIAKELGVNRNTVNDDIKYWSRQIASQFGKENLGDVLCKQIERLEIQRKRLFDDLNEQEDITKKLQIEKLLFEIDYKIAGFLSKVLGKDHQFDLGNEEISDNEIIDVIRKLCLSENILYPESHSNESILKNVISITCCDAKHAQNILKTLKKMGLDMFKDIASIGEYDVMSFAVAKRIVSPKEKEDITKKWKANEKKEEDRLDKIERRYNKKYGSNMSKWSKQVVDQMDEEMNEEIFGD